MDIMKKMKKADDRHRLKLMRKPLIISEEKRQEAAKRLFFSEDFQRRLVKREADLLINQQHSDNIDNISPQTGMNELQMGESSSSTYLIPLVFCSLFITIGIVSVIILVIVRKRRKERGQYSPKIAMMETDLNQGGGDPGESHENAGGPGGGFKGMLSRSWSRVVHSKKVEGTQKGTNEPFLSGIDGEGEAEEDGEEEFDVEEGTQLNEQQKNDVNKEDKNDDMLYEKMIEGSRQPKMNDESYGYLGNFDYESTKEDHHQQQQYHNNNLEHPFDIRVNRTEATAQPDSSALLHDFVQQDDQHFNRHQKTEHFELGSIAADVAHKLWMTDHVENRGQSTTLQTAIAAQSNVHQTPPNVRKNMEAHPAVDANYGVGQQKDVVLNNNINNNKLDQWKYQLFDLERGEKEMRMIELAELDDQAERKVRKQQEAVGKEMMVETSERNDEENDGGGSAKTKTKRTPSSRGFDMETIGDWVEPVAESRDLIVMQEHAHLRRGSGIMDGGHGFIPAPVERPKKIPMNRFYS